MSDERVRAKIKRERQVNTFAELSHANDVLLQNAQEKRSGWSYECMTVILMAAFKLEAYRNQLGERVFDCWGDLETLSVKSKLNVVRRHLGIADKDGERPFQTVTPLFRFRNTIAHGKSEFLETDTEETGTLEEMWRKKPGNLFSSWFYGKRKRAELWRSPIASDERHRCVTCPSGKDAKSVTARLIVRYAW